MTNDIIQQAEFVDPQRAINALPWPDSSLIYLEKVITGWLPPDSLQAPQLTFFDPNTDFKAWERGRIFCTDFELRWEKVTDKFRLVYVGKPMTIEGFSLATDMLDLAPTKTEKRSYYLWGRRVAQDNLEKVGLKHEPKGIGIFIEMRVNAHLYYPVQHEKTNRIKLKVCQYRHQETGQIMYHRYQELEEELSK